MGMAQYDYALAMRDAIRDIATNLIKSMRPDPRVGVVTSINRFLRQCEVLMPGDTQSILVGFSAGLQPARVNDTVEVSGKPGNYYVSRTFGDTVISTPMFLTPETWGGLYGEEEHEKFFGWSTPYCPVGSVVFAGSLVNTGQFLGLDEGDSFFRIRVAHPVFSKEQKLYEFPISWFDSDTWRLAVPIQDSGPYVGNDFQLEVRVLFGLIQFRVRALSENTGFVPGGYKMSFWVSGAGWEAAAVPGEAPVVDAAPTLLLGREDVGTNDALATNDQGPFFDAAKHMMQVRGQFQMTGGDPVLVGSSFRWSTPIFVITGANWYNPTGVFQITMPTTGTAYAVHGETTGTTQNTTADGFVMAYGGSTESTLYYDPDWSGASTSVATKFHLVTHDNKFMVPSHWIRIATYDSRYGISMSNGITMDSGWKTSGITAASNYSTTGTKYRVMNNLLEVRLSFTRTTSDFVSASVTGDFTNQTVGTLPAGFRPNDPIHGVGRWDGVMVGGLIGSGGAIILENWGGSGASYTFVNGTAGELTFIGMMN